MKRKNRYEFAASLLASHLLSLVQYLRECLWLDPRDKSGFYGGVGEIMIWQHRMPTQRLVDESLAHKPQRITGSYF